MDEVYLKEEQTLQKFVKLSGLDQNIFYNYKKNYPNHEHPTLVLDNLYEVNKHNKKLIGLEAAQKTGRTLGSLLFMVDQFVQGASKVKLPEDVGCYLLVIASTREQCATKHQFIEQILQGNEAFQSVDINQFFPLRLKGKPPQIILPPTNVPTILVSTPGSFLKLCALTTLESQGIFGVLYDECDLIKIYGGEDQIKEIYGWLQQNEKTISRTLHLFVASEPQIERLTGKKPTLIKIENEGDSQEEQEEVVEENKSLGNYFYHVAKDEIQKFIILYITLKLNLLQGKTLIVVEDLTLLYKLQLFFQRTGLEKFQIYNHENPKTLKYYVLSTFNTGVIQTLIATPKIFEDMQTLFFERAKKDQKRKDSYTLKNVDNIVVVDLDPHSIEFTHHLNGFGNVLVVQDRDEEKVGNLLSWITTIQSGTMQVSIKEYPLSHEEIEAFRYRIQDVVTNISKHQVKQASSLDFKKKMIKSPDLVDYFVGNPKEKEILQQQIVRLKSDQKKSQIVISGQIPDYLLPEIIKHQRKIQNEQPSRKAKYLVFQEDKDAEKIKLKRKMLNQDTNNMLPIPLPEEEEQIDQRLLKKLKLNDEKFIYVDEDKEDPTVVDASKLKTISSRKLWKLKHGFKLKKRNKRLERKGVFTA